MFQVLSCLKCPATQGIEASPVEPAIQVRRKCIQDAGYSSSFRPYHNLGSGGSVPKRCSCCRSQGFVLIRYLLPSTYQAPKSVDFVWTSDAHL